MPIADLLGVQLDTQMLGKLTLSVAAVLLVSWAYKFYSSRGQAAGWKHPEQSTGESNAATTPGFCTTCQKELRQRSISLPGSFEGKAVPNLNDSQSREADALQPDKIPIEKISVAEHSHTCTTLDIERKENTKQRVTEEQLEHSAILNRNQEKFTLEDCEEDLLGATEDPVTEYTPSSLELKKETLTSQSRSPCLLKKLEPNAEVGRELRQELERLGTFSSFQSKAAVKVKDVLLERPGAKKVEVRGKVYEYYVDSSSESISDSTTRSRVSRTGYNKVLESNTSRNSSLIDFSRQSSSSSEHSQISSFASPLILRDLVFPPEPTEEGACLIDRSPSPFSRPELTRKDSYRRISEDSDLRIPLFEPRASSPIANASCPFTLIENSSPVKESEPSLETIAGLNFLQMPQENIHCSELEGLKGKLDLGNCIPVLSFARKHGHVLLTQAALKIMSDNYLQVLRDPDLYGRLKAGDRALIQKQRLKGKRFLIVADIDPQDWTKSRLQATQFSPSSALYFYDDYKDSWHILCSLPKEVISKGCSMCTMDNYLFIAVGCENTTREVRPSRRVFCYNPVTSIWKEISPMNEARPQCKLVALLGYIYAIGGECLSSVERYDPRADRWTFVSPLPNDTFAVAHRATACHGELYVSGGTLRYTLLRYNPKNDLWRQSLIVGNKERTTEMVAVGNFLYRFDISPSLGLSVYRYHTVARLWYECCSLRKPDCLAFQCAALDDVIYCVNRQFNMRLLADEISPGFVAEDLKVLAESKGMLFPFVLTLSDKDTRQTTV